MRELYELIGLANSRVIRSAGFLLPVFLLVSTVVGTGCSAIASSAGSILAGNLTTAMMDQEDPELVREAVPSYLLLIDSFIVSDPESAAMLDAGGQLYAAYGAAFVDEPERAKVLTARARDYGERALCARDKDACNLSGLSYDEFVTKISPVNKKAAEELYTYSLTSLAYIRSNSDDYVALADLPKVEYALEHLLSIGAGTNEADTYLYLGVLNTLRPAALGGKPEEGKAYFEKAIAMSDAENLAAKVEYARSYARLVYDRELHDRLLNEVMAAPVKQPGKTLFNVMAQEQAEALLVSADEYF
jgi:hypothetical protein